MRGLESHLITICQFKNSYKNNTDPLGIWQSSMPVYYLPEVNVLPDFIHLCHSRYEPTLREILSPDGSVLFHITPQSINQMLNYEPPQSLVPLTLKHLIDSSLRL